VQHNHYLFTYLTYVLLLHYLGKRWMYLERSDMAKLHVDALKLMPYLCQDERASFLALRLMDVIIAMSYWCSRCCHSFVPLLVTLTYVFQQDSAPAHRVRQTVELLQHETLRIIAPDLWPPNSRDHYPVNYRICGVMQDCVYQTPVRDVTDLKQCLADTWNGLSQSIIYAVDESRKRLRACVKEKVRHFEHLL